MKKLFQYTVLFHEYNKEGEFIDSKIIVAPTFALAKSEKDILFRVTREVPEEYASSPDNVQILVRNF